MSFLELPDVLLRMILLFASDDEHHLTSLQLSSTCRRMNDYVKNDRALWKALTQYRWIYPVALTNNNRQESDEEPYSKYRTRCLRDREVQRIITGPMTPVDLSVLCNIGEYALDQYSRHLGVRALTKRGFLDASHHLCSLQFELLNQEMSRRMLSLERTTEGGVSNAVRTEQHAIYAGILFDTACRLVSEFVPTPETPRRFKPLSAFHELQTVPRQLDAIAADVQRVLNSSPSSDNLMRQKLSAMNQVLFQDYGFAGNSNDYYNPKNSVLSTCIETKHGIPLTLAILYVAVGRRVGVPATIVGAPGHIVVHVNCEGMGSVFIDVFNRGNILSSMDFENFLRAFETSIDISPREIAQRMRNNFKATTRATNSFGSSAPSLELCLSMALQSIFFMSGIVEERTDLQGA